MRRIPLLAGMLALMLIGALVGRELGGWRPLFAGSAIGCSAFSVIEWFLAPGESVRAERRLRRDGKPPRDPEGFRGWYVFSTRVLAAWHFFGGLLALGVILFL